MGTCVDGEMARAIYSAGTCNQPFLQTITIVSDQYAIISNRKSEICI